MGLGAFGLVMMLERGDWTMAGGIPEAFLQEPGGCCPGRRWRRTENTRPELDRRGVERRQPFL